jgi:hypothetical protein
MTTGHGTTPGGGVEVMPAMTRPQSCPMCAPAPPGGPAGHCRLVVAVRGPHASRHQAGAAASRAATAASAFGDAGSSGGSTGMPGSSPCASYRLISPGST